MKYEEYAFNASEATQIERLLNNMPEDMVVERMGLERRLAKARRRLDGIPVPRTPKKLYATFRGGPVHNNSGINANFGADAMTLLSDAITMVAAGSAVDLKSTGRVPNREASQPIITGVATGSFGFELEVPSAETGPATVERKDSQAERAVKKVQDLFALSTSGSDSDLSEIADEIHPRAVKKVVELLELMKRHDARLAIVFDGREFRFHNNREIIATSERLSADNVRDETDTVVGTLIGILPATGRFQINRRPDGAEIEGKLARGILNAYELSRRYTSGLVTAEIRSVQVGQGKPSYTLTRMWDGPDAREIEL